MSLQNAKDTALQFAGLLVSCNYSDAHEMTTKEYQENFSVEALQISFENIFPDVWGKINPVEFGETMSDWPDKESSDVAWVYVILGGDVYSEALMIIVSNEDNLLKVRDIEFGRP